MDITKFRYYLLLLILIHFNSCSSTIKEQQKETRESIFNILNGISEQLDEKENHLSLKEVQQLCTHFDSLNRRQIYLKPDLHFDELLDKFEKFRALDSLLMRHFFNVDDLTHYYIYQGFKFHFIVEIQKQLEQKYYTMSSLDRLSYSARFIYANRDFSLEKTDILKKVMDNILSAKNTASKKKAWFSISMMLVHIDLDKLTSGNKFEQLSHYGLRTTKKKIIDRLESIAASETDQDIRQYASQTIKYILDRDFHIKSVNKKEIRLALDNLDSLDANAVPKSIALFDSAYQLEGHNNKINYYDRVLKLDPEFSAAYFNRGIAYVETGQYAHAINDFSSVIHLNPSEHRAGLYRGIAYLKSSLYAEAISDLSKFIIYDNSVKLPGLYNPWPVLSKNRKISTSNK